MDGGTALPTPSSTSPTYHDIGTAWLVLTHGVFISAAIAASSIATRYLMMWHECAQDERQYRLMILIIGCWWGAASTAISMWTLFAIYETWLAASHFQYRIFKNGGYLSLVGITLFVAAANIAVLTLSCHPARPSKKPNRQQL